MNTATMLLAIIALVLSAAVTLQTSKQLDKLYSIVSKQALREADFTNLLEDHDIRLKKMKYELEELEKRVSELPVEDMQAAADAEKAWNEGVQNIVSYGLDSMKKGGLTNE